MNTPTLQQPPAVSDVGENPLPLVVVKLRFPVSTAVPLQSFESLGHIPGHVLLRALLFELRATQPDVAGFSFGPLEDCKLFLMNLANQRTAAQIITAALNALVLSPFACVWYYDEAEQFPRPLHHGGCYGPAEKYFVEELRADLEAAKVANDKLIKTAREHLRQHGIEPPPDDTLSSNLS